MYMCMCVSEIISGVIAVSIFGLIAIYAYSERVFSDLLITWSVIHTQILIACLNFNYNY